MYEVHSTLKYQYCQVISLTRAVRLCLLFFWCYFCIKAKKNYSHQTDSFWFDQPTNCIHAFANYAHTYFFLMEKLSIHNSNFSESPSVGVLKLFVVWLSWLQCVTCDQRARRFKTHQRRQFFINLWLFQSKLHLTYCNGLKTSKKLLFFFYIYNFWNIKWGSLNCLFLFVLLSVFLTLLLL